MKHFLKHVLVTFHFTIGICSLNLEFFYSFTMLLIVSKVFCEFEKRRTEDTNHDRVVRFSVFCHAWSGVYLLSEAFIAAGCTQFVVMTIVTNIHAYIYIYILLGHCLKGYGFRIIYNSIQWVSKIVYSSSLLVKKV